MPGIVIEPLKLVYWPVPKNACTSIKLRIIDLLGLPKGEGGNPHTAPFTWTPSPIEGYRDFALVRNPFWRLLSLWVNKIARGHPVGQHYTPDGLDPHVFGHHVDKFRSEMPLGEFAKAVASIPLHEADPHWAPQSPQLPFSCHVIQMEQVEPLLHLFPYHVNRSHVVHDNLEALGEMVLATTDYYKQDCERFGYYAPCPTH